MSLIIWFWRPRFRALGASKRDVIFFGRGALSLGGLSWRRGCRWRRLPRARGFSRTAAAAFTTATGVDKGEGLQDNFEFALFLVSVFVLPLVEFQAAFD